MVKSIRWDNKSSDTLNNLQHFKALVCGAPDPTYHIFPNLRGLVWQETRKDCYPLLGLFVTPHMDYIDIDYTEEHCASVQDALYHLRQIGELLNCLRRLQISPRALTISLLGLLEGQHPYVNEPLALVHDLQQFIQGQRTPLTGLNVVLGRPMPDLFLTAPGSQILTSLTSLALEIHDPAVFGKLVLPRLTSLDLTFNLPTRRCVQFARALSCPKLDHLSLSFGVSGFLREHKQHLLGDDTRAAYLETPTAIYMQGVLQADYHASVTSFTLKYHTVPTRVEGAYLWEHVAQLAEHNLVDCLTANPFPRLQALSISTTHLRSSAEWLVTTLPRFFPRLHTLAMTRPQGELAIGMFMGLDLSGVRTLVARLPALRRLTLQFDDWGMHRRAAGHGYARFEDAKTEWDAGRAQLRRWDVLDSMVGSLAESEWTAKHRERVALGLHRAFPLLGRIDYRAERDRDGKPSMRWAEVEQEVRALRDRRS